MIREEEFWVSCYDADEAMLDGQLFDELMADDIELSSRASRKLGDNLIALARTIRSTQRKDGSTDGWVHVEGRRYYFEVIRTKLTPTINPYTPKDPDNFRRTISVCTKKELKQNTFFTCQRHAPEPARRRRIK